MRGTILPFVLVGMLTSGCAVESIGTDESPSIIPNGIDLNGIDLNGIDLNGIDLNGGHLGNTVTYAMFDDARLDHQPVRDAWIEGSELVALVHHSQVRGVDLAGLELRARSDTHRDLQLRISDVEAPAAGDDVWRYWVDVKVPHGWASICEDASGNPEPAIAVSGFWNYRSGVPGGGDHVDSSDRFTLACPSSGAIGKCIVLGYKPWASVGGVALDDLHESCTRLLRADFCGDGTPHTVNGTLVNVYDALGIQTDDANWGVEAEWAADGARCMTSHLRAQIPVSCLDEKLDPSCGNPPDWDGGTLLVSESP